MLWLLVVPSAVGREQGDGWARAADHRVTQRAATAVAAPTIRELIGQKLVVAMQGTSPSPGLLARIRGGEVGGIILFGANIESRSQLARSVAALQRAAAKAGDARPS